MGFRNGKTILCVSTCLTIDGHDDCGQKSRKGIQQKFIQPDIATATEGAASADAAAEDISAKDKPRWSVGRSYQVCCTTLHGHAPSPSRCFLVSSFPAVTTNIRSRCTCRFVRRVDRTLQIRLEHSNIAVVSRGAVMHPPASTAPTPRRCLGA